MDPRGRSCPLAYRYQPEALAQPAQLEVDTLYVVGGLYGNPAALVALLERAADEPAGPTIVFNGDVHWLDVDPEDFQAISETVLAHHAIKGNVEAELASEEDAGCGCAYPGYIGDDVVDRSNQIMTRLRATASRFPALVGRLGDLPRHLTASVGGRRVGILHGDPEALAGWRLALEAMEPADPVARRLVGWRGQPTTAADLEDWFGRAEVDVFACTHTGLPYAQAAPSGGERRLVINNGTAGLPNFAGTTHGVITRLSSDLRPPADSLYGATIGGLRADACPSSSMLPGGRAASWPSGHPAAPVTAPTSPASPAAPTCGCARRPAAASSCWVDRPAIGRRSDGLTDVDEAWHHYIDVHRYGGCQMATTADPATSAAACCAPLGAPSLSDDQAAATARLFRALADPHRVKIVNLLATSPDPVCVCEFTGPLGLSQPTVSHHLKKLVQVGLLDREQRGTWAYYRLRRDALGGLAAALDLQGASR